MVHIKHFAKCYKCGGTQTKKKTLFPIYSICQTPGNMLWIRIYNTLTNPIEIHFSYAHAYVGGDVGSSWMFFCNVVLKKCEKSYSST